MFNLEIEGIWNKIVVVLFRIDLVLIVEVYKIYNQNLDIL